MGEGPEPAARPHAARRARRHACSRVARAPPTRTRKARAAGGGAHLEQLRLLGGFVDLAHPVVVARDEGLVRGVSLPLRRLRLLPRLLLALHLRARRLLRLGGRAAGRLARGGERRVGGREVLLEARAHGASGGGHPVRGGGCGTLPLPSAPGRSPQAVMHPPPPPRARAHPAPWPCRPPP